MVDAAPIEQIARDGGLLPCPFCGGKAEQIQSQYSTLIRCSNCGTEGKSFSTGVAGVDDPWPMAIAAWNTRQACGQQPAMTEPGLIQDVYIFVEAALKIGDHSKELDFIRHLLGYIEWQKRTHGSLAGYKLVPIEPTEEMINSALCSGPTFNCRREYLAMLAAAPTPPVQQPHEIGKEWLDVTKQMPQPPRKYWITDGKDVALAEWNIENMNWKFIWHYSVFKPVAMLPIKLPQIPEQWKKSA